MYITIHIPPGVALAPGAAELLLGYARRRAGKARWGAAAAEVFSGPRGTLLVVRPALSASVADYALPRIREYRRRREGHGKDSDRLQIF